MARIGREGINWAAVHDRIDEDNRFKMSADEVAPTKQSPLSADLLSVLKNGEIKIEELSSLHLPVLTWSPRSSDN
ncbi:hypothetical protein JX265_013761 [Neoarthrinium moseri]|uniref:Uncharacterized protein n=1 Tax=Neoarthrinium moseri TaxID=1658444 RepID=A0A9P9W859_9PEZI|nr:hypothetical protein JX265_013761 [Neoarthrinium moseri]